MPDIGASGQAGAENIALPWFDSGCSVIPVRTDGTKRPQVKWDKYQTMRPLASEVRTWWGAIPAGSKVPGIAVICGKVSGNLEMLELEGRATNEDSLRRIENECELRGVNDLWTSLLRDGYAEWTPAGGVHLLYRLGDHDVPGNTKLANNVNGECLAETRGEGGYVIVAPTPGYCHPSGEPWQVAAGRPGNIPTITWSQRQSICNAVTVALDETPPAPPPPPRRELLLTPDRTRPGDDFNVRASWEDSWFTGQGWRVDHRGANNEIMWRRPGKQAGEGHSASTGYAGDADRLYVWSTSAGLPTEQPLTKFFVFAHYHHNGDFAAAARDLANQGYGEQRSLPSRTPPLAIAANTQAIPPGGVPTPEVVSASTDASRSIGTIAIVPGGRDVDYGRNLKNYVGNQFHYVTQQNRWVRWDGKVWKTDHDSIGIERAAVELSDEMLTRARANGDRRAISEAEKLGNLSRLRAAVQLLRTEPGVAVEPEAFDADTNLVNLHNGVLDLKTCELLPHDPKYLLTKTFNANYIPTAQCPQWRNFLDRAIPDPEMRDFVQRMAGYTLLGKPVERAVAIIHGPGRTGKSRFIETLARLFGDYSATAAESLFRSKRDATGPTNDLHSLRGARFACVSELDNGVRMDEALVKRLSGFDQITSRAMYQEFQTWTPQCVIWLATNHHFKINSDDGAIWDRMKVVPFRERITDEEMDPNLLEKLLFEADGIFNWLLEGVARYRERGLQMPGGVTEAVDAYRHEQDTVGQFIGETVADGSLVADVDAEIEKSILYAQYVTWCKDNLELPLGKTRFNRRVANAGYIEFKRSRLYWRGLGVAQGSFFLGGRK